MAKKLNLKQSHALIKDLTLALNALVVRFPIEGHAVDGKCKCLQYEDHEDCRHLVALDVNTAAMKVVGDL